jgi:hypothetical protein
MKLKRVFCTIVRFSQYLDTLAKSYSYDHIFSSHRPSPFSMSTVPGVFCGTILGRNIPVLYFTFFFVGWLSDFYLIYFKGLAYFLTVSLLKVNALAFLIPVPTESGSTEKPSLHIFKMRLWGYLTIFSGINAYSFGFMLVCHLPIF